MRVRSAGDDERERLLAEENTKRLVTPNVLSGEAVKSKRGREEDERAERNALKAIHAMLEIRD
jgi:hypothetical protein